MFGTPWKKFVHPAEVYYLEYPAHWDQVQQDEARSCGFGPHERDDVGLWISILPMSVDTERLADEIPKLMNQMLEKSEAVNPREDATLKHTGWKADMTKDGQGGNYWIMVGGDIVLFASTQVPIAERDTWNPAFDRVMASLQITRDDELLYRQMGNEILQKLKELHPDEEFEYDDRGIKGKHQRIFLSNVFREVKSNPKRRDRIIKDFITGLSKSFDGNMGYEEWDEVSSKVMPVLKPRDYIDPKSPTKHLYIQEWLTDVVICYVIKRSKYYRFLTGWDLDRWNITGETLHERAIENLVKLSWPSRLEGVRQPDGSRLIMLVTDDGLASSRILHPGLHKLFSGPLGTPFWAGIPNRETLVAYSNRRSMKKRIPRQLKKDHDSSAYPITAQPFLVTPDGIAPATEPEP
jgi:uncharacterized protein YtpQ (UPF0354 family)